MEASVKIYIEFSDNLKDIYFVTSFDESWLPNTD